MALIWFLLFLFAFPVTAQTSSQREAPSTPDRTISAAEGGTGGLLNARSSTCGMVGNGTTDDTAGLQSCVTYAITHQLSLYLPTPSSCYLITKSIDATRGRYPTGFWIIGDTAANSKICDGLTEPYPVIDFGGCSYCGIRNIAIIGQGHNYTRTRSTAGVLASQGRGNGASGGSFKIDHCTIQTGALPGTAGAVLYGVDGSGIHNSNISSFGAGVIMGNTLGAWIGTSKFYRLHLTGNSDTLQVIQDSGVSGRYNPALQLTGSSSYNLNDSYFVISAPGTGSPSKKIIEMADTAGYGDTINGLQIRTENQTGGAATGVTALYLDSNINNGIISGVLATDAEGFAISGASPSVGLTGYKMSVTGGGSRNGGAFFNFPGTISNSDIAIQTSSFGSVRAATASTFRINGRQDYSTVMAAIAIASAVQVCAINSGCEFSNILSKQVIQAGARGSTRNQFILTNGSYANVVQTSTLSGNRYFTLPDAASNPVQPLSSAPSGGCLGYIDSSGVQHGANCGSAKVLSGATKSIGGSALAPGTCASGIVTIPGAKSGMAVAVTPSRYPGAGISWNNSYVSSSNNVTVQVCNFTAGSLTPAVSTYNVRVIE